MLRNWEWVFISASTVRIDMCVATTTRTEGTTMRTASLMNLSLASLLVATGLCPWWLIPAAGMWVVTAFATADDDDDDL